MAGLEKFQVLFIALMLAGVTAQAATITVTGAGDVVAVDGAVTLREAMTSINSGANVNADVVAVGTYGTSDTINFNISGSGLQSIALSSPLPAIVKPVLIDAYTQPGASVNMLPDGDNAVLTVELDGSAVRRGAKDSCSRQEPAGRSSAASRSTASRRTVRETADTESSSSEPRIA